MIYNVKCVVEPVTRQQCMHSIFNVNSAVIRVLSFLVSSLNTSASSSGFLDRLSRKRRISKNCGRDRSSRVGMDRRSVGTGGELLE